MKEKFFTQPSVMNAQAHFSAVPNADIERSRFDRSHAYKTTFDAGKLIPVFMDEVLPGDTFDCSSTAFCRLATPLKPIMDNIYLDTHFFFVPYRLVWDNWQAFCGERRNPTDDPSDHEVPKMLANLSFCAPGTIGNYMGLPHRPGSDGLYYVSALPLRAYILIWNEWYRDQNLQNWIDMSTGDDAPEFLYLTGAPLTRGKRHDYFTSCLPWPQKGDPVFIPLGTEAPVYPGGTTAISGPHSSVFFSFNDGSGAAGVSNAAFGTQGEMQSTGGAAGAPAKGVYPRNLWVNLQEATAVTINDLRTAFQIQRLLERDARGGTRYIELVLAHFGVRSDDARLQRPEYLGGSTAFVNVSPVAATVSQPTVPQGNLAAVGTSVGKSGFNKSFTEHGIIIGLMSARADLTYQQGLERFWSRKTRYDFYWPALAHLGEQAVLNLELFATGTGGDGADGNVFGYQERYAEYRYKPSRITGLFASDAENSLDVWHLSQDFETIPVLNASFITENPPIDRVIAVPSEPHFLADIWFDLKCTRPMPVYSVPGLIDHF